MPLGEFSMICFEFLSDFWRKSQNEQGGKIGQKSGLRRREGCLATVRPRAKTCRNNQRKQESSCDLEYSI